MIVPSGSDEVPVTDVILVNVQYVPVIIGAAVGPLVTTTLFDAFDKHLVPLIAKTFTVSQPCKVNALTVHAPPAVVVAVPTQLLFTYNTMNAPATLSGAAMVPLTDVDDDVRFVVVMVGVAVGPDDPRQNQTGCDSHIPGNVAETR